MMSYSAYTGHKKDSIEHENEINREQKNSRYRCC